MKKSFLFLSHLVPHESNEDVERYAQKNMQDAANALQWHLLSGFMYHLNRQMDVINLMLVGSYPQYYKKAFIKEQQFDINGERAGVNVGYCNVKFLRRYSMERHLYKKVQQWCEKNKQNVRIIICYSLHPNMMKVLAKLKANDSSIQVCAIVADLPHMMNLSSRTNRFYQLVQNKLSDTSYFYMGCVDKFVFLTKQMSDYLKNEKPYCVMEGIATDWFEHLEHEKQNTDEKIILYTGTLHKKFGVLHLVEAFSRIDQQEYRLVICGAGDSETAILEAAKKDTRIRFMGQCKRMDVLRLQKQATVLVNPRMNIEEFTKYSFPSKNMEYMSSGTPLVAYKLDGIPDEYEEYVTFVRDNKVETLAETLVYMCELPDEMRSEMGNKAKAFVLEHKNEILQTKKILELLDGIL